MGINTIMNSVNTLSDAVHALITNMNPRNKTNQNVQSKAKPTATVTRPVDNNIIPLESKLSSPSNSAALNDFEIDLLKDHEPSLPLHCNFTQDNSVEYERASSYDPNDLFDKVGAFDCADQSDNDKWDLPQLDTDEKTGPKVLDNLAAALNAEYLSALLKMQLIQSQKSMQDLIIVPIYVHPE